VGEEHPQHRAADKGMGCTGGVKREREEDEDGSAMALRASRCPSVSRFSLNSITLSLFPISHRIMVSLLCLSCDVFRLVLRFRKISHVSAICFTRLEI